jgi:hypothetical protein
VVEATVSAADPGSSPTSDPTCAAENSAPQKTELDLPAQPVRLSGEAQKLANNEEAGQNKTTPERNLEESAPAAPQQAVRRHGSAKPVV